MRKICIAILFLLCFCVVDANAQRLVPGQMVLTVDGYGYSAVGGGMTFGYVGYPGKATLSFSYSSLGDGHRSVYPISYKVGENDVQAILLPKMNISDILLSVGYDFRVVGSRRRSVNLYVGAEWQNGIRMLRYGGEQDQAVSDWFSTNTGESAEGLKYVQGVVPRIVFEVFPFRRVSLSARAGARITYINPLDAIVVPDLGLSLNFYLSKLGR